jgi:hypothetical protein
MERAFWRIMASIALVFICSCTASKAVISENRSYGTGIGVDEGVVIVLNTFLSDEKSIESEGEEKSLANCVEDGMIKVNPRLKSLSAKEFRHAIFPNKRFLDSPRSSEALFSFLGDPEAQSRVMKLGVRYLVILSASTHESEPAWKPDGGGSGSSAYIGVVREWKRFSNVTANVLDVNYLRESGSVAAASSGECGWGGLCGCGGGCPPCLIPIPLCYVARTEAEVCPALGQAVMNFLIEGRDIVPTPELGPRIDRGDRGSDIQSDIQAPTQPASEEDLPERPQEPGQPDKDSQN